ncbi:retrograde regulation protein 2 [Xylaria bambusicola]|uniref:retrograde regulation protein 2 n=1 Tax=Xylaria bambusicola TaxID=326684 RepID=UPI002008E8A5|nr:retrograde regulation protein 2 [Xylaria bambusicola]KAI0509000.1 retrograde regulation protein 2 [Xylaria bambusicola]
MSLERFYIMSNDILTGKVEIETREFAENGGGSEEEVNERRRKERALVRRLDCCIVPVLMVLNLISYLDRGNIGFAATQGMTRDIQLKGNQLNTAVSVFYIFYILAEFPTSIFVKRLRFDRVIPTITLCWGLICLFTGFVQSFGSLVATRILLGFFEGCLFPSITLCLCNWYKREELGLRIALLFIASALAGAFGGLLAWAVFHLDGVSNMAGWRWLYILEGLITVVWAGLCIVLLPRNYETAYFLDDEQKALMKKRAEEMGSYGGGTGHYTKADIKEAAKDVKSWVHALIQIAIVTVLYGFSTFLPIIIKDGFQFSTIQAQYLVIPVNIWGSIVYAIGAILSDRYSARFLPLVVCAPFGIAGYAILLCDVPSVIRYFATYLIAIPCFLCTGGNITWLSVNCAPDGKRAASLGIQLTLTNIGGVIAGQIYQSGAGPSFTLGHAWSLGSLSIAFIGWWIMWTIYTRRQASKDKILNEGAVYADASFTDRSPNFKYQI